jgi:tetratricopeptide (TPR) repeat protein
VIELMLEAERALAVGLLDQAERHYAQVVAADPRNAIAIVGLARVSLERGDQAATYRYARRALALDPDNPAASHLVHRMSEQFAIRGEPLPSDERPSSIATPSPGSAAAAPSAAVPPASAGPVAPRPKPSLLDRIRGRARE